jgi:hypothetical protein
VPGKGNGFIVCEHDRGTGANARRRMFVTERTKTTALDNGPNLVKGPVVLLDAEGNVFGAERATLAPYRWDGTHKKVGFRAGERAVRGEWGVGS